MDALFICLINVEIKSKNIFQINTTKNQPYPIEQAGNIQSETNYIFFMQIPLLRYKLTALSVLLLQVLCFSTAFSQSSSDIHAELNKRLLREDISQLAETTARESATDVPGLARQAVIFSRAGQDARAKQAARKLLAITEHKQDHYLAQGIYTEVFNTDLTGWKEFYERTNFYFSETNTDYYLTKLLEEWEKKGDLDEIESWLVERHAANKDWFDILFAWRIRHGRADEMKAALCREVQSEFTANPADLETALKFLQRASMCRNVNAFIDNFASTDAFDYYWLGTMFKSQSYGVKQADERAFYYEAAAKFLRRSLELPYKPVDAQKMGNYIWSRVAVPIQIPNFNSEKQLRFWTKTKLAEVYKDSQQPLLAQPLVEDLTAMDKTGIQQDDPSQLAGAVQAASGMRVVETRILQEEVTRRDSSKYWLERVSYYQGRKEPELVRHTLIEALKNFPYNPQEKISRKNFIIYSPQEMSVNQHRLRIIDSYLRFLTDDLSCDGLAEKIEEKRKNSEELSDKNKKQQQQCEEIKHFLRNEIEIAANNGGYLYLLLHNADSTNLERFTDETFAAKPEMILSILNSISLSDIEGNLLVRFAQNKQIPTARKQRILSQIEAIATDLESKYRFAANMIIVGENDRGLRLLQACESALPPSGDEEKESAFYEKYSFERSDVYRNLFKVYLQKSDWKNAEKVLLANSEISWHQVGGFQGAIEEFVTAAASNGATDEAVRLWKVRANFDRRRVEILPELAKTKAREPLRQFYLQMKQRDPHTTAPEKALAILQ